VEGFLDTPLFGIIITILSFEIGIIISKKINKSVLNPFLIAIVLLITVLLSLDIPVDYYNKGGDYISFFLGPATVILAVPLYRKIELFKKNVVTILVGITVGSISAITSVLFLSKLFNLDRAVIVSMIPKSVTTPIGLEISRQIGGIPAITVAVIVIAGVLGAVIGPTICKIFKIDDEVAVGVAIGTASHALGTSKAIELGETQGAMSGLSIGVAGLITVFLVPLLLKLL